VRLALAALRAAGQGEAALAVLAEGEPTRGVLATRAALLARAGRYDEAEQALAGARSPARSEPARHSWPRCRERALRREQALRAALAERRGDFDVAERPVDGGKHEGGTLREPGGSRRDASCALGTGQAGACARRQRQERLDADGRPPRGATRFPACATPAALTGWRGTSDAAAPG
jgi:hypothetical protein